MLLGASRLVRCGVEVKSLTFFFLEAGAVLGPPLSSSSESGSDAMPDSSLDGERESVSSTACCRASQSEGDPSTGQLSPLVGEGSGPPDCAITPFEVGCVMSCPASAAPGPAITVSPLVEE